MTLNVTLNVIGARDLVAADSGGTSDPYAVVELIHKGTGQRVGAKLQTGKQPKTLEPTWNETKTWSDVKGPVDSLVIRIAVFDKDRFSSTSLGTVEVPLISFSAAEEASWHVLECTGKMKVVSGEVQLGATIELDEQPGDVAAQSSAPTASIATTIVATAMTPDELPSASAPENPEDTAARVAQGLVDEALHTAMEAQRIALLEQCNLDSLTINVVAAENLIAADKNGKSDPFTVVELIDVVDQKPIRGQSKLKTKCIKKTLNPEWNESKTWKSIKKPASAVVVRLTVFDQDMFTSEALGTVSIPAIQLLDDSWATLEKTKQMSNVSGRVHLKSSMLVEPPVVHAEDEPGTFTIELLGARRLPTGEAVATAGTFATAEIVWESSGEPYFRDGGASSLRTKTVARTSSPSWHAKKSWYSIASSGEKIVARITILRSEENDLSSDILGRAEIPLSAFVSSEAEPAFWHELTASSAADGEPSIGDVQIRGRFYPDADAEQDASPGSRQGSRPSSKSGSRPTSKSGRPRSQDGGSKVSLSLTLVGAKGLLAADKGGTSDPYAVAEILMNGEVAKGLAKLKTSVAKKTLTPIWNAESAWVNVPERPEEVMTLRISVFDKDMLSSTPLGSVDIPISALEATPDGSFRLEKTKAMKNATSDLGEVQLKAQVVRMDEPGSRPSSKGGKMTCTVTVVDAKGLLAADKSGTSDPFATAELVSKVTSAPAKGCSKFKTSTKTKTLEPSWQQTKVWKGVEDLPDALILRVRVFDSNLLSSTELGETQVPLTTVCNAGEMYYKLRSTEKMKSKMIKAEGQIKLKASYSIVADDGEKVVYVRDSVWTAMRNFEKHRRGALVNSPPSEERLVEVLNELLECDRHLYTVQDLDEDDIVNSVLLLDFGVLVGHAPIVDALLEAGLLEGEGMDVTGALRKTFQSRDPNVSIMKSLLFAGANLSLQNKVGQTPIVWALEKGEMDFVDTCLDPFLMSDTAAVSAACLVRADDKRSCLHVAAERNLLGTMRSLLKLDGIEKVIDSKDSNEATPLFTAIRRGHEQIAIFLAEHGASADIRGPGKVLPLAVALEEGQRNVVLRCLSAGAGGTFKKKSGETALIDAVLRDDFEMFEKCLACETMDVNATEKAQSRSALILAITLPRPAMLTRLLDHPMIDPNIRHASRCTPLIQCVLDDDMKAFSSLVAHAALKVDARDSGLRSALSHAVALGRSAMAHALLSRGADVNLADGKGMFPLHHAQDEAMVLELVNNGADLDAVDKKGKSAVVLNVELGKESMVTYMMLLGADVDVKSKALEKASLFRPLDVRLRLLNVLIEQSKVSTETEESEVLDIAGFTKATVKGWLSDAIVATVGSNPSSSPKLETPPITLAVEMEIIELLGTQAGRGTGHDELEFMTAIIDSGVVHVKRWSRHVRNCLLDPALSSIKMVEQLRPKTRLDLLKGRCHSQKELIQNKLDAIYEAKRYSRSLGRMTNQMKVQNDMLRQDAEGLLPSVKGTDCNENGLIHLFQMLSLVLDERFHKDMNLRCLPSNESMVYKQGEPKTYDRIYARMLAEDIAKARPRCAANLDVLRSTATFDDAMSMARAVRALTTKYDVARIDNSFARAHKSSTTRGFRSITVNFIWPTELTFGYLVKVHSRPSGKWSKYVRSVPKEQRREATGALKFLNSNSFRRMQINMIVEVQFTLRPFLELGKILCHPYDKIIRSKDSRDVAARFQPEIHLEDIKNMEESLFLQVVVDELLEDTDTYNKFKKLLFELHNGQTGAMTAILRGRAMLKKHPMLDSYFMAFVRTGSASGV